MAHPSPELVELARRIVELEAGAHDAASWAAGVDTACLRLTQQLVDLLGADGVSALLRRALHMAQREQPLLAGVAVNGESDTCYSGLAESLSACTEEEATAAAATVLTYLLDLLVVLFGEDLGMKPVRKLWPRATGARENDA